MFRISDNGLAIVAQNEGLRLKAYDDAQPNKNITSASQVKGTLTIGYGHTRGVKVGQTCTQQQAMQWLRDDIKSAEADLTRDCKVRLTQNMVDALVDMYFNIGGPRCKGSTFMARLNAGNYEGCAEAFLMWNKPDGIIGRRKDAKELFLRGMGVLPFFDADGQPGAGGSSGGGLALKIGLAALLGLA